MKDLKKKTGARYTKGLISKDRGPFYISRDGLIQTCGWYTICGGYKRLYTDDIIYENNCNKVFKKIINSQCKYTINYRTKECLTILK